MASEDQLVLIDMISAVKLLSIDSVMQTVRQIIKQPPQQDALVSASKVSSPDAYYCASATELYNALLIMIAVNCLRFVL